MVSGIDLNATVEYTLKSDKKDPTIWKLGTIRTSIAVSLTTPKFEDVEKLVEAARFGIKGWQNFKVGDKDFPYPQEKAADGGLKKEDMDIIPLTCLIELGSEILKISKLQKLEAKN